MSTIAEVRIPVTADADVVVARQRGRQLAAQAGLDTSAQTMLATAISEIVRNIVVYAGRGEVEITTIGDDGRVGIEVVARDEGPGIEDVDLALRDGYSSSGSLGLGLPGARRLVDEFEIETSERGTVIVLRMWARTARWP